MPPLLLLLLAYSFLLRPAAASAAQPSSCWPKTCGSLNITYPFWVEEPGRPPCGPPAFQLKCNSSGAFLSRSIYQAYRVESIFPKNRSLHVVDINLPLATGCPAPKFNVSIVSRPLFFSKANKELLFLGKCTESQPEPSAGFHSLPCDSSSFVRLGDGRNFSRSHVQGGIPPSCFFAFVPVLVAPQGNGAEYIASLKKGFLLEWTEVPGNCPGCMASGGECAYGDNGLTFACKCSGSLRPEKCGGITTREIAGIGGVGAGGILLVACLLIVWHKRKRRKQARAPNGFTRSESSMQSYSKDLELGGSPHIFTYEELEEATDGFSDSRELGDGGFGTVYKGKLRDGRVVAVKRLYKNNYKRVEQFINEVDILSRLLHQNLVILYGCTSRSSRDLVLVYEYIPNGTVADHLHGPRASEQGLTWPVRMNIAIETAEALAYLHAVEIIHRDVKTNNILLDNSFHVKVADFGLSRLYPLEVTHVSTVPQGTPGYVDPVYHQCYKLTDKSDVYSFGVVLVELISSKPAVDMSRSHSEINLANMALNRIQNHEVEQLVDPELGYETDSETKRMIDLVAELAFQCLQLERELRPSIKEVVEALNCIKNGDSPEKRVDMKSSPKEDAHLLKNSIQYSPDSVIHRFHSQSTTHSVASNASG
ncbi:LEAF RUST 10 DISEASE-RESISTANCE LOCUS RECEPTOR-LIKE PROTEIN KINASE-like 1.2 isoform X4 [Panicum hallii]|uniref:LEAF RUST 10 DISEASE-RESISTANCE LOCUS RECEPTOR-LIKE PROTEIN KINASE-like 1.2 isoform X4 n=1 Tax=Panicum hallii TaxID=206008 RepID=UPI000DF4DEB8|nr:LEAF RUST 10 DISEASE-RESISTANCE LOCUS RECEPTOR-LIKE PROTEIN KINASE-like 1.2 isoform X4 [Panicum hallii]